MKPLFEFPTPLIEGVLIKRYKRFLADIKLNSGEIVTAHCTNSGSMESCIEQGAPVMISKATDPNRKTQYTWEMININNGWIGVNTAWPNLLGKLILENNIIPQLSGFNNIQREVKFGDSRFDIFAEHEHEKCFIEVKNVTLKQIDHVLFPDAVTERGQKHLKTLMEVKNSGMRAAMLYVVQRTDVKVFSPAWHIDKRYAETLVRAINHGVEVFVAQINVLPRGFEFVKQLPIELHHNTI